MTGDGHASYFGQYVTPMGDQAITGNIAAIGNTTGESISNNPSSQTLDTGTTSENENRRDNISAPSERAVTAGAAQQCKTVAVGTTQQPSRAPVTHGQGREWTQGVGDPGPADDTFRADIVSKLDKLVEDFRKNNSSRTETLYQIFSTLHDAGLEEPDRRATLEKYTMYIDIVALKHKNVEQ
ncbi:hypothetical protein L208DRAFT_401828 [Tricholoma matsutake]|nr:hypothetical protein L208DRAFT_401828 [Tricholoma matsutake 945]